MRVKAKTPAHRQLLLAQDGKPAGLVCDEAQSCQGLLEIVLANLSELESSTHSLWDAWKTILGKELATRKPYDARLGSWSNLEEGSEELLLNLPELAVAEAPVRL